MDLGLRGRSVVLFAASEGIGLASAKRFAAEGARLSICSRDKGKLQAAVAAIRAVDAETPVFARTLDVTRESEVQSFVDEVVRERGGVDVCVANAGGPPPKPFLATTGEEWQRAVELNLLSVVYAAHAVLPHMQRARWGRFVTISSVSVRQPVRDLVYSNSVRAAVVGLVKSLSNEVGRDGITVNNVAPGYTATARLRELAARRASAEGRSADEVLASLGAETALGRVGEADEVADAIVWLSSERAAYVTGQTLLVDGGLYRGL